MHNSTKTKIAFFADILVRDFDGAARTMFQIIDRVPKDRFEIIFFCGEPPTKDIGFEVIDIPTISIPFNSSYKMAIPLFHMVSMTKRLDEFAPDVIHIASPSPLGNFALDYKKKRDIPTLCMYHTHFISYVDYYLKALPFLVSPAKMAVVHGQKVFYNKSDKMMVPTQNMVDELSSYGFDEYKMQIWQRGINHDIFNPSKRDLAVIRKITGNDKPNIIFASRLVWEKNLATLINVYRHYQKEGQPYNFILAGNGPALDVLQEKMPEAYFLGKINHDLLSTLYASSDVFVFPSTSETYGNVVVEAMASGCPCVIAKGGGSQSLVQHGETGFLCRPKEICDYVSYIDKIIKDKDLRLSLIENGLVYTKSLNWNTLVDVYFETIFEMANPRKVANG